MSLLERLSRLHRAIAGRAALALALGTLGALAALAAVLALGARGGLFAGLRWVPLAWWAGCALAAAWVIRAIRGAAAGGPESLRAAARLVEAEQGLRRGALVGLVDSAGALPAGTSPALAGRASRAMDARLPPAFAEWAPERLAAMGGRLRAAVAAGALGLLAATFSLWYAGEAAAALVSPLRAVRAAVRPRITLVVSARAVRPGESVTFSVRSSTALGQPTLLLRVTGEAWRPIRLEADANGAAEYRVDSVRAPLFAYARLNGATSDTVRVAVLEPLLITGLSVTARYPEYLERDDEELDPTSPLVMPVGTVLGIAGSASVPLARAALEAADTVALAVSGPLFRGALVVRGSAVWRFALSDPSGAQLGEAHALEVRAIPDSAPSVSVPVPGADTTAPLDLRPVVVVDARDDHGLARVEIVSWRVSRLGVVGDTVVDSIAGVAGADRVVQSQVLELTRRGLLPGDTVRFFARAGDRAPVPHTGRSREYALRLRSMAELREAIRTGADSLSREAAGLAADQAQLTRQTEDLAAQRDRSAERGTPPAAQANDPRARERPDRGDAMNFERAVETQQISERQRELVERAQSLREELERLARAAEDAGLNDPRWQEQLRNLEELLRQAITPELEQRLEELRRALERLDPRAVQEALRRLAAEQQALREQLQRSAELFERAAIEGSLQTHAQNVEALRRDQERWNERAPQRRDSTTAAAEEQQLRQAADTLARQLEELEERLRRRGDSAAAGAVDSAGERVQRAAGEMQQAAGAMQRGARSQAAEAGRRAAQQLESVPQDLENTQRELSAAWRAEVLRLLSQSLNESVVLAGEEQRLARELRRGEGSADARGRQSAAEQGVNQLMRQLQSAAGRNALVSPRLGSALAQAREQVARSRQALEGPSPSLEEAGERAQEASQLLSAAALQMMRSREEVGGAQSGSGFAEALQRMAQMAGQQGELNDQLGGLIPLLGAGQEAVLQQLRLLARRQRSLANELERLGESGMPGRPDQLAEEARQLADRIESARLDRATLERQQRLFRRMLDAGRTLRNEDEPEDPERKSRTATDVPGRVVRGPVPREEGPRYPVPSWSTLRNLPPSERAMVLDYFRRLNAPQPRP